MSVAGVYVDSAVCEGERSVRRSGVVVSVVSQAEVWGSVSRI